MAGDSSRGRPARAHEVDATATFTDANGQGSVTAAGQASVPYPSLSSAFDNPGISDDASTTAGNLEEGSSNWPTWLT